MRNLGSIEMRWFGFDPEEAFQSSLACHQPSPATSSVRLVSFRFSLQPKFDQPADGFRARGSVRLFPFPFIIYRVQRADQAAIGTTICTPFQSAAASGISLLAQFSFHEAVKSGVLSVMSAPWLIWGAVSSWALVG
jgi:hypothetical protein